MSPRQIVTTTQFKKDLKRVNRRDKLRYNERSKKFATRKIMTTTADDVWQLLAELVTAQKETERRFQETDRKIQEVSKQIGALGGKWGRFVEKMVAPACETLFFNRGIPVHQVSQRVKKRLDGKTLEIDVLVTNEDHVLVVEVKSSLGVDDVKELSDDLSKFRQFFPEYNEKQVYGAVAGIEIEEGADKYAYRQGLFVLVQSGENVAILNDAEFQPKVW
ncbi:hypothetical protein AsFPU1_0990 [Aphanothece sacrum FPU1]|uniref:DUF3782 domain-containing protein n=2 Tax=Aphanothece sacrum TaxID=1122 RepID=A0A401IE77_APHSA|nr:hypothetical protein AsFPU1_0990 [Aphanothece sacrum FPU1]GBF87051.1 hypothetical protein AsFPU3_4132 [Aphanothece sacrum FPU3]